MDWKNRNVQAVLERALLEDNATSDMTSQITIDNRLRASGTIIAKQECVVSGLGCVSQFLEIFARIGGGSGMVGRFEIISHPEIFDGVRVRSGQSLAVIRHTARSLLGCERVILNLMQRMSGIATLTRKYVDAIAGTGVRLLDTRKTTPGLRMLEKYAVVCGGGHNHRLDLSDGILIKNNHIALGGGLPTVLARALAQRKDGQTVEIEVRNTAEVKQALDGGADSLLLDNMTPSQVKDAVKQIRAVRPTASIEASGGITLENIRKYAETGVNYISSGALTHSAVAVDMSMRITPAVN
jgi:nicotinate-nucleotide pyrophosphorylase (carboxylating)